MILQRQPTTTRPRQTRVARVRFVFGAEAIRRKCERFSDEAAVPPHPSPVPLGEGEDSPLLDKKVASEFPPTRSSILPLPAGEGWGEGERCKFSKPSFNRPRLRAFTLLELILVMALLTIVLSVSAPSLANFFRGRTLDSEARRFLSLTRYAQSRAVSEGIPMQLWIDDQARTYGVQADPGYTPDDAKAVSFQIAPDLTLEIAAATPGRNSAARTTASSTPAPATSAARPGVTTLNFQPDGFLSPNNPTGIRFRGSDDATLTLSQSRNRLNYEIQSEPQR